MSSDPIPLETAGQLSGPGIPGRTLSGSGVVKILSAAEIQAAGVVYSQSQVDAAIAAAVAAYLPLAGGTLTGPITGTSDLIEQRRGLNAQCFDLYETYTSGTNNGKLRFKATSSGHQIGSAIGSSGGSNRALRLGHFDAAGTFTSVVSFNTGAAKEAEFFGSIHANLCWINDAGANYLAGTTYFRHGSTGTVTANIAGNTGVLTCAQIIHVPPTSTITLATNGQFSIEMTSNTAGNLVYRGSDGTTRRMALTFI